jgi:hypothetical protein
MTADELERRHEYADYIIAQCCVCRDLDAWFRDAIAALREAERTAIYNADVADQALADLRATKAERDAVIVERDRAWREPYRVIWALLEEFGVGNDCGGPERQMRDFIRAALTRAEAAEAERAALERRVEALEAWLRRHEPHEWDCDTQRDMHPHRVCTCGLSALLAPPTTEGEG